MENDQIKFTSFKSITDAILEGMKSTKEEMIKEGLWNENTTFEDWAKYAGSHVKITEQKKCRKCDEPAICGNLCINHVQSIDNLAINIYIDDFAEGL